jgi:hypothetical protein
MGINMSGYKGIASDLANVGCSCDNDGADYCPFLVGHCRKQEKAIESALLAAEERGRIAGLNEAAEIGNANCISLSGSDIAECIRVRAKNGVL